MFRNFLKRFNLIWYKKSSLYTLFSVNVVFLLVVSRYLNKQETKMEVQMVYGHSEPHNSMMILHGGVTETIIFAGWTTTNTSEFVFACFVLMMIGVSFEALRLLRDYLVSKSAQEKRVYMAEHRLRDSKSDAWHTSYIRRIANLDHIVQTILHCIQFSIGYFIMLAFMISNYWLCLSIVIGIGIGYFFFGIRRGHNMKTNHLEDEACSH